MDQISFAGLLISKQIKMTIVVRVADSLDTIEATLTLTEEHGITIKNGTAFIDVILSHLSNDNSTGERDYNSHNEANSSSIQRISSSNVNSDNTNIQKLLQ